MDDEKRFTYKYKFVFEDGSEKEVELQLDKETLQIILPENELKPEWARYENFGCHQHVCGSLYGEYCPIALNLQPLIHLFSNLPSFTKAKIYVEANDRTYFKETSIQSGIGSLIGIIMVTSGCTTLSKLRPMVHYHLPFATIEETEFRVFSMYALAQYLKMRKGLEPDWNLADLKKLYEDIQIINRNIAQKIADLEKMDASINAVVILNTFAESVTFSIDDMDFGHLEKIFKGWF